MKFIDAFSRPTAADHLALDEALLLETDKGICEETLRCWEFEKPTLVVGRSSKIDFEVNLGYCKANGIEVLRRCSGGASIVGGPGCLMYSVVLSLALRPELRGIDAAHAFVMQRVLGALRNQAGDEVAFQGTCDLTWQDRKCSGNSLRVTRQAVLYHGTILYNADLDFFAGALAGAPRQPDYRAGRDHRAFMTNVAVDPTRLQTQLCEAFGAEGDGSFEIPESRICELREQRYDDPAWHFRH